MFNVKLPEDDHKKIETLRYISELYELDVKMYFFLLVRFWVLTVTLKNNFLILGEMFFCLLS